MTMRIRQIFGGGPQSQFEDDLRLLFDVLAGTSFANRYRVCGGILLGWAREGRLLPNDPDADFFFDTGDTKRFREAVPALEEAGFERLYRFRNNDGVVTEFSFVRHDVKFEFFRTFPAGPGRQRYFVYAPGPPPLQLTAEIPAQPLTSFKFLGRKWLKSQDHELELTTMYGDWRTPDLDWSYMNDCSSVDLSPWNNTGFSWS